MLPTAERHVALGLKCPTWVGGGQNFSPKCGSDKTRQKPSQVDVGARNSVGSTFFGPNELLDMLGSVNSSLITKLSFYFSSSHPALLVQKVSIWNKVYVHLASGKCCKSCHIRLKRKKMSCFLFLQNGWTIFCKYGTKWSRKCLGCLRWKDCQETRANVLVYQKYIEKY